MSIEEVAVGKIEDVRGGPGSAESGEALPRLLNAGGLIAFYAAFLLGWEFLVPYFKVPAYIAPVPSAIAVALYKGLTTGTFVEDFAVTMFETLSGFGIAVVGGFIVGALIVEVRYIERVVYPLIVAFQSVPKIAMAPLLLIWIGFGIESKIAMAALVAFFPMLVNTISGLRSYDRDMHELFNSLSASRYQQLRYLKFRAAVPFLIAGIDVSFIFALLGSIVGEFVGASAGLGYVILQLQFQLDTAGVFAILVLLGLIGVSGHSLIGFVGRRVAFWQAINIERG